MDRHIGNTQEVSHLLARRSDRHPSSTGDALQHLDACSPSRRVRSLKACERLWHRKVCICGKIPNAPIIGSWNRDWRLCIVLLQACTRPSFCTNTFAWSATSPLRWGGGWWWWWGTFPLASETSSVHHQQSRRGPLGLGGKAQHPRECHRPLTSLPLSIHTRSHLPLSFHLYLPFL